MGGLSLALLLSLASSQIAPSYPPGTARLIDQYVEVRLAWRINGTNSCHLPGYEYVLQRVEQRVDRIRAAFVELYGSEVGEEADNRVNDTMGVTDFAYSCTSPSGRSETRVRERNWNAALRPLEAALGLRRH